MAKDKKRYFLKRDKKPETEQETLFHFPQISRTIPAEEKSLFNRMWNIFILALYATVTFFVLIQLQGQPAESKSLHFTDALINAPRSYKSHLLYLESLVIKNRLNEAQHELDFLELAQTNLAPSNFELEQLNSLQRNIAARKIVFYTTINEYNQWNEILKIHPEYRDVYYRIAQKDYMLFNENEARLYLKKSIDLDPQFEQGKRVLQSLSR